MTPSAVSATAGLVTLIVSFAAASAQGDMTPAPAGTYTPFQRVKTVNAGEPGAATPRIVAAFSIEIEPVTNAGFLAFVRDHPQWRKTQVKALFADARYLRR
jgi:formylglycine-generating enzyme required for sulfatase activity